MAAATVCTSGDEVAKRADIIIVRLLGGRASFRHGLDRIVAWAQEQNVWLICLPGTDALDPELAALSTTGVPVAHEAFAYLQMGGVRNYGYCLRFLADHLLAGGFGYDAPEPQPRHGLYHPDIPEPTIGRFQARQNATQPTVGILFYRSHLLSGNTAFVDAIVRACEAGGLNVLPVYTYSLKEGSDEQEATANSLPAAMQLFLQDGRPAVDVIINTTSFAMGSVSPDGPTPSGWSVTALTELDVPVIQAITASSTRPAVGSVRARPVALGYGDECRHSRVRRSHHRGAGLLQGAAWRDERRCRAGPPWKRRSGNGRVLRARCGAHCASGGSGGAAGRAAPQAQRREARRLRPDELRRQGLAHR